MNLGYRGLLKESKTHVYLLKERNAGGQQIIYVTESKLEHDARCIKQVHFLLILDCMVCGCHHCTLQCLTLCLTYKDGQYFN